jgi:hypothetical protein
MGLFSTRQGSYRTILQTDGYSKKLKKEARESLA